MSELPVEVYKEKKNIFFTCGGLKRKKIEIQASFLKKVSMVDQDSSILFYWFIFRGAKDFLTHAGQAFYYWATPLGQDPGIFQQSLGNSDVSFQLSPWF